jgi:hypothetical protein
MGFLGSERLQPLLMLRRLARAVSKHEQISISRPSFETFANADSSG